MGDMEFEQAIFCNQSGLQVEGLRYQPNYKTFSLQLVLPAECSGTGN